MSLPYEKTYCKPASFTARIAGDDRVRFRSMASTGMALVAGRIAFGARDSQSSFTADATLESLSVSVSCKFDVWRAEDPGLAACGRRGAIIRPAGRSPLPPATRENRPASSRAKRTVSMNAASSSNRTTLFYNRDFVFGALAQKLCALCVLCGGKKLLDVVYVFLRHLRVYASPR